LSGGRDVDPAFAEAVALAFEGDHGGVVDEPVDQGSGDHRVAGISPHCSKRRLLLTMIEPRS
jgi:hypothetical protein